MTASSTCATLAGGDLNADCDITSRLPAINSYSICRVASNTFDCRGDKALVHWWYWPDSYDEYVPAESASDVLEPDKTIEGEPVCTYKYCSAGCQGVPVLGQPQSMPRAR